MSRTVELVELGYDFNIDFATVALSTILNMGCPIMFPYDRKLFGIIKSALESIRKISVEMVEDSGRKSIAKFYVTVQ